MTHMLPHTQFTSRDRVMGLEGCYLICGAFLIGNLIPGPRNLVFADRFFHTGVIGVFLLLLGFPLYKITTKSKWRLQRKTVFLEDGFSKLENQPTFFLSFKSESRRPMDRVGSTPGFKDFHHIPLGPCSSFKTKHHKFLFSFSFLLFFLKGGGGGCPYLLKEVKSTRPSFCTV